MESETVGIRSVQSIEIEGSAAVDGEEFMPHYIFALFDERRVLTYEDSDKFGQLVKNEDARLQFAKLVDARRVGSKRVSEISFYRLLRSFALVLFECAEADNYKPGKILMNMAFTYYYIPSVSQVALEQTLRYMGEKESSRISPESSKGISDTPKTGNIFRSQMRTNLQKAVAACRDVLKEIDIVANIEQDRKAKKKRKNFNVAVQCKEKYLYECLKNQPIWRSSRFWEEAFLLAVSSERERRCTLRPWSKLSKEERHDFNGALGNITFGQLVTFLNNMKCLGVTEEKRREFINKHSEIGGIEKTGDMYLMLLTQLNA